MRLVLFVLAGLAAPSVAVAHAGGGSGVLHGLAHPMSGLDHVLAMLAVGLLAYRLGGRALCLVPASFVGAMAFGAALALTGTTVPMVEFAIGLSVATLGRAGATRPWPWR